MGEPLAAEPTTATSTESTPLSTNSVAFQSSVEPKIGEEQQFGVEDAYRALIFFCDKYQLDKKQVALGLFLTVLLVVFSVATVIAWNRYSPIIQEFIIKENIEKARAKDKNNFSSFFPSKISHFSRKRRLKSIEMNRFKKFINKKRVENHFKKSGEGVRLGEPSGSSGAPSIHTGSAQGGRIDRQAVADIAAMAADKRMLKNQPESAESAAKRRIQMIAKRELEQEKAEKEMANMSVQDKPMEEPKEIEMDHSSAISQVLYTSELLGEQHAATKEALLTDIQNFLQEQIEEADEEGDKVIAAVLMLYSLNKQAKKETAIETIGKYCQNILEHPGEEKFKSIRLGNKAFQERVASAIGGRAFLEAVGFVPRNEGDDEFLTFTRDSDAHLVEALEALRNGQAVPIKVARNLELFILKEGQQPKAPKLAAEFFNLSASEVKTEQKAKEVQVDRMLTLRTKEMRKNDELVANYRYKYTLIRLRLPGNILMQGVFGCHEPFSAVRLFVASALSPLLATSEFAFRDAVGSNVEDENVTLAQLSLAPAALLHVVFSAATDTSEGVISDEYVHLIRELDY